MFSSALLAIIYADILVSSAHLAPRIIGGHDVHPGEIPYQVSIRIDGLHHCGGSVIDSEHVLTAAHCFKRKVNFTVYAGSINRLDGGSVHNIDQIIKHEKYGVIKGSKVYDIAILKISPPFTYDINLQPVGLPESNSGTPSNVVCVISGWGLLAELTTYKPTILRKASVTTISKATCDKQYRKAIPERQICAQGLSENYDPEPRDACQADSGGPLVHNGTQLGIISWGMGCGDIHHAGVYTEVSAYVDWIRDKCAETPPSV